MYSKYQVKVPRYQTLTGNGSQDVRDKNFHESLVEQVVGVSHKLLHARHPAHGHEVSTAEALFDVAITETEGGRKREASIRMFIQEKGTTYNRNKTRKIMTNMKICQ